MSPHGSPQDRNRAQNAWRLFAFLWATAVLVDRAKRHDLDLENLSVVVPAILLLAMPGSILCFAVLATLQVYWWVATLSTQIIWNVSGMLHGTLLITLACLVWRHRTWRVSRADVYTSMLAPVRALLVLGMGFAGFAKLNHDFLEPELSCGAVYYLWMAQNPFLSWLPVGPTAQHAGVWFAVVGECAGPLFLLWRRTRVVGIALVLAVWLGLSLSPRSHYFDFVGLFVAMVLFFLPLEPIHDALVRWRYWLRGSSRWVGRPLRTLAVRRLVSILSIPLMTVLVLGSHFGLNRSALLEVYRYFILTLWLCLCISIGWSWVARKAPLRRISSSTCALVWIGPALFALNEVSPYVGLPHRPTMTMAANLILNPAASNHLLVDPVPTFSWSRKVTIVRMSSSVPGVKRGRHVPWLRFANLLAKHPTTTFEVRIDDGPVRALSGNENPSLASRSFLADWLRLTDYETPRSKRNGCSKPPPGMNSTEWRKELRKRLKRLAT